VIGLLQDGGKWKRQCPHDSPGAEPAGRLVLLWGAAGRLAQCNAGAGGQRLRRVVNGQRVLTPSHDDASSVLAKVGLNLTRETPSAGGAPTGSPRTVAAMGAAAAAATATAAATVCLSVCLSVWLAGCQLAC
jgi:hypothetical protein